MCSQRCVLLEDFNLLPTNGFSIKPLKVKLLAGEQKVTVFGFGSAFAWYLEVRSAKLESGGSLLGVFHPLPR